MNSRTWDYWLLWCVALLSLAGNIWLVSGLLEARRAAGVAAGQAAEALAILGQTSFNYDGPVNAKIPVVLSVPIDQMVTVPISVSLPIDMEVNAEVPTPFGGIPFLVPIHTRVPVRFDSQVPLHLVVPISATLPVSLTAPVRLRLADTALGDALAEAQAKLEGLARDWQKPIWSAR